MSMLDQRFLGGEAGHRSLLTGRGGKGKTLLLFAAVVAGIVLALLLSTTGLIIGAVLLVAVFVATLPSQAGSPLERAKDNARWRQTTRSGIDRFVPVSRRPREVTEAFETPRRPSRAARLEYNAYRDWPEGAQSMVWLHARPGTPGIAWHAPTGEDAWLSVVFPLHGAVSGLESNTALNNRTRAFGAVLAELGSEWSLAKRIQIITRVQPIDTAAHEAWAAREVDPEAPPELLGSYREVLERLGTGTLRQKHFAVVRWPVTPRFKATASALGPEQQGWLWLMRDEIDRIFRELDHAGLGPGPALSAAQVGAVLRHQQNPSWPIDQAGDVNPFELWMPSRETRGSVAVHAPGPDGTPQTWLHRTAVVPIESVTTAARDALWMMPMLSWMRKDVVRTISVQLEGIPKRLALKKAQDDFTSDLADEYARAAKGQLVDGALSVAASASKARIDDLEPGQQAQGLGWAMHVTVSARTPEELREACGHMREAADKAAIGLQWLDTQQAAAQACTWPLARGMRAGQHTTSLDRISGNAKRGQA